MALSEKIVYMAEGMGINRAGALLNKVPTEAIKEKMIRELEKRNVQTLGTIHFDPEVQEAGHGDGLLHSSSMDLQLEEMMGDAPVCDSCGHITVRNGACYKCLNCGNSLGCS